MEVKLKEFGVDLIEVSDNGSGISPSNYEGLALKYHTSKLASFSDLSSISSFGFRGEALSSLCELAGCLNVTTRTDGESVGVKLSYRRDGKLTSKVRECCTRCPAPRGLTGKSSCCSSGSTRAVRRRSVFDGVVLESNKTSLVVACAKDGNAHPIELDKMRGTPSAWVVEATAWRGLTG